MNRQTSLMLAGLLVAIFMTVGCNRHSEKVTDFDGKSYSVVQIGSMSWLGANLDVAHYRNGDPIPEVRNPEEWADLKMGAWCNNDNRQENGDTYGKLYNWYAVTDQRGLAPDGWHVATDAEWTALSDLLGGMDKAGGALKANTFWKGSQTLSVKESGFDALPAGARRDTDGKFMLPGEYSRLWSATEISAESAWCRSLGYFDTALRKGKANKKTGFSVRCVKNVN
jgi:uncharacterized protein (TIGR02145 family)